MLRVSARGLWSRKRRLLGMLAAVFLGVAFLSGTLGLSATMSNAISTSFATAYQGTDVIVRNATATQRSPGARRGPISGQVLAAVRSAPGVASAQGEVTGFGEIVGGNGKPITGLGPRTASSWLTDPQLNPWHLVSGAPPRGSREVVIDQGSATKGGLRVGQQTTVFTPEPVRVTVTGIARYGTQPSDGGSSYVAFTLASAQQLLLRGNDQLTAVVARAGPGISQDRLAGAVRAVVPSGTQVITGQQATSEQIATVNYAFLSFFRAFLGVFAGIALLVAGLSIHNASDVIAAQRIRESALLRALGASRRQIFRSHIGEAAVLGLLASVAGVAAGYGMAAGLKGVFAGFGLDLPVSGVVFTLGNAVIGLAAGVAVALLAAVTGALRASRTSPLAAMRDAAIDGSGASRARAVTGAVLTGGGVAICFAGALGHRTPVAGLGALVILAEVIVAGPTAAGTQRGTARRQRGTGANRTGRHRWRERDQGPAR